MCLRLSIYCELALYINSSAIYHSARISYIFVVFFVVFLLVTVKEMDRNKPSQAILLPQWKTKPDDIWEDWLILLQLWKLDTISINVNLNVEYVLPNILRNYLKIQRNAFELLLRSQKSFFNFEFLSPPTYATKLVGTRIYQSKNAE